MLVLSVLAFEYFGAQVTAECLVGFPLVVIELLLSLEHFFTVNAWILKVMILVVLIKLALGYEVDGAARASEMLLVQSVLDQFLSMHPDIKAIRKLTLV